MIVEPQETIRILKTYDFQCSKRFGQNFLIDRHALDKIIASADLSSDDTVIEIGPGIGALTEVMAMTGARVITVEIDDRLIPILTLELINYPNIEIVNGDFMKLDLKHWMEEKQITGPVKFIANLPYYITTPIIMKIFESGIDAASLTLMVQEEVARRMEAGPGTKDYGALSLAVQYYAEASIAAYVPPNCFMPRPGVGSCVIRLVPFGSAPVDVNDTAFMFDLIRAAFLQRRKTLGNSLSHGAGIPRETIQEVLLEMCLDPQIRGEKLSLGQYAELSNRIQEHQRKEEQHE